MNRLSNRVRRCVSSSFDYIIVGGGSAGCVLANRLSSDPSKSVLLIEAGGSDDYFWIPIPAGYLFTIGNAKTDWCMRTEPDPGLNGRSLYPYARGFVIGGCSSINAMIAMRGQRWDYDSWAKNVGSDDWSWDSLLPLFKRLEDFGPFNASAGDADFHGVGGPLRIESPRVSWKVLDHWREAAKQCGIPSVREFNRGDNFGCAYFHVNQRAGRRVSMADAFLRPIQDRQNLTVLTQTACKRVILDNQRSLSGLKRAVGVLTETRDNLRIKSGVARQFDARCEVILSAGALQSPAILQMSGIGNGDDLNELGVPCKVELRGVGRNLQDHLQIRTCYRVQGVRTLNSLYNNLFTRVLIGLQYLFFRSGPLTMPPSTLGAFAKSDPSRPFPNIEWHVQPLSLPKFSDPLDKFDAITPSVCNLRPSSRGSVRANKSLDPYDHPTIWTNYLSTGDDQKVAVDSLRFTRRILAAPALAQFEPDEFRPGPSVQTDEDLLDAARNLGTTIFHPVGTCKMGRAGDLDAVVDSHLRVRGVDRLRVVDASIMPTITSGNTNYPTVVIAERASQYILEAAGSTPHRLAA